MFLTHFYGITEPVALKLFAVVIGYYSSVSCATCYPIKLAILLTTDALVVFYIQSGPKK